MDQPSTGLQSTVQVLTLTRGLYLVSVTSAAPRKIGDDAELVLPAIHVGPGPGATQQIELMTGPRNNSPWLCEPRDMVIVKVTKGPANLLLTSLRGQDMPNMEVEVQRLEPRGRAAVDVAAAAPAPATAPAPPRAAAPEASGDAPVRIDLHLQNRGDVSFTDAFWAGELGERLAIEAFAITPLERVAAEDIEYKALMENGVETEWASGGEGCGSRGQGVALIGFAVRLKGAAAGAFDCEYRGSFSSGKIVGPVRNGAPCHADDNSKLEAIQLQISERAAQLPLPRRTPAAARASENKPVGPRFSVFRDERA
ncbi:MAG TPA: hypothetical protein VGS12_00850 [Caulobacteraceae bacterium]|nr:hypothetical protein [Caulobacteraceae bacterium]